MDRARLWALIFVPIKVHPVLTFVYTIDAWGGYLVGIEVRFFTFFVEPLIPDAATEIAEV